MFNKNIFNVERERDALLNVCGWRTRFAWINIQYAIYKKKNMQINFIEMKQKSLNSFTFMLILKNMYIRHFHKRKYTISLFQRFILLTTKI